MAHVLVDRELRQLLGALLPDPHAVEHGGGECPAVSDGLSCTLDAGHRGPHVAHATGGVVVGIWADTLVGAA